ncbi:MAG TPA: gamma-glutamylcyclotransferase family protein [Candidatus Saccharimonadia bacterium]|jgi:gamma-glutamylcyclotransferase (GGCT)/AIG2-like uncharacterized protein YtfP|nr:gamma-glutamylcyclotransferase family protein [Candidatus Saccharimonadia bacterium]
MLYFAYGSNMSSEQMQHRCPGSVSMGRAKLADYELRFDGISQNWGSAVANIEPMAGHSVLGSLYEVSKEHLELLDGFEHVPVNYQRRLLRVQSPTMGRRQAVVYMRAGKGLGSPNYRYLWQLIKGGVENRIPIDYLAQVVGKSGLL